uniref:Uncharacterized protein n=1 Tax=Lactuca sativa TaxID=4236 RepID=A0A9R1X773_LACSA|nr:hypothetical protein LSAT_V11C500275910 [Lactuca sativa]
MVSSSSGYCNIHSQRRGNKEKQSRSATCCLMFHLRLSNLSPLITGISFSFILLLISLNFGCDFECHWRTTDYTDYQPPWRTADLHSRFWEPPGNVSSFVSLLSLIKLITDVELFFR